ncbi:MAG: twin-arginine translocase subunit TatC, partial [Candidatus Saccharimonadales bacterium]
FQLPLIIIMVNRFKPLKPKQLFNFERYVIAGAFIVSMLMAPTINLIDQLIIAGPIIIIYQIAIVVVVIKNRSTKAREVHEQGLESPTVSSIKAAELPLAQTVTQSSAPSIKPTSYLKTKSTPRKPRVRPGQTYRPVKDFDFNWTAKQGA